MNERIKSFLSATLGTFGAFLYIVFQILLLFSTFAPLLFLDLPVWLDILFVTLVTFIPFFGGIIELVLWCITLPIVIGEPFSFLLILYYICLAISVIFKLIPTLIGLHRQ